MLQLLNTLNCGKVSKKGRGRERERERERERCFNFWLVQRLTTSHCIKYYKNCASISIQNIAIQGVFPRDVSCSINQVLIKEVNKNFKGKWKMLIFSFFIYMYIYIWYIWYICISYESCWAVANGSLNPNLLFR